jgi:predicted MFS family arabinose efflux permease
MWFAGLVIGAAIGGALGSLLHWHEAWLFFGAIGTVAGALYKRPGAPAANLEQRVAALQPASRRHSHRESRRSSASCRR